MNIKLLLKVKAKILKEPKQFQMSSWFRNQLDDGCMTIPNCGTAACIGGWILAISKRRKPRSFRFNYRFNYDCYGEILELLDVNPMTGNRLFNALNWPTRFRQAYNHAVSISNYEQIAKVAAERIDWFIKTDGTDIDMPEINTNL